MVWHLSWNKTTETPSSSKDDIHGTDTGTKRSNVAKEEDHTVIRAVKKTFPRVDLNEDEKIHFIIDLRFIYGSNFTDLEFGCTSDLIGPRASRPDGQYFEHYAYSRVRRPASDTNAAEEPPMIVGYADVRAFGYRPSRKELLRGLVRAVGVQADTLYGERMKWRRENERLREFQREQEEKRMVEQAKAKRKKINKKRAIKRRAKEEIAARERAEREEAARKEAEKRLLEERIEEGLRLVREKEEREAKEKKEAEEKAAKQKKEAEEKAAKEKKRAEEKAAKEKKEAEEKAAKVKKEAEEKAAKEKKEAEEKAVKEKKEAEKKAAEEITAKEKAAKEAKEKAAKELEEKKAAEVKAAKEAEEKKAAEQKPSKKAEDKAAKEIPEKNTAEGTALKGKGKAKAEESNGNAAKHDAEKKDAAENAVKAHDVEESTEKEPTENKKAGEMLPAELCVASKPSWDTIIKIIEQAIAEEFSEFNEGEMRPILNEEQTKQLATDLHKYYSDDYKYLRFSYGHKRSDELQLQRTRTGHLTSGRHVWIRSKESKPKTSQQSRSILDAPDIPVKWYAYVECFKEPWKPEKKRKLAGPSMACDERSKKAELVQGLVRNVGIIVHEEDLKLANITTNSEVFGVEAESRRSRSREKMTEGKGIKTTKVSPKRRVGN